jgi:hypothetical protein
MRPDPSLLTQIAPELFWEGEVGGVAAVQVTDLATVDSE